LNNYVPARSAPDGASPAFTPRRLAAFLVLAAMLLVTREYHFEILPDASSAIFFLGGFYLNSYRPFAALAAGGAIIDYNATQNLGVSSYCLSPAYVFLLPSYAALWVGGRWAGRHRGGELLHGFVRLGAGLVTAVSVCFLISNASFYWLSGRAHAPSLGGWLANFFDWYPHFLSVPCAYVGVTALAHAVSVRWATSAPPRSERAQKGVEL
jgi:hypothetical protein